ncbi:hypothetical protein T492DRAFT_562821, partial [Pavlovales sp. CCMP2436]
IQIFVKMMSGKTITLDVKLSDRTQDVKAKIFVKERIPIINQRLLVEESGRPIRRPACCSPSLQTWLHGRPRCALDRLDAIKHNTGIAPDLYFLTCEGRQLDDQRPLRDYDIENEATLRSTCRMRGG